MVLTAGEIASKAIVHGGVPNGARSTTYDATVGSIIKCGRELRDTTVTLKPREIIWLVSAETFELKGDVTGLATLKTSWTHQGVLALNVGIVDPGWHGPLAAAVVNLSSSDFEISMGMPFLRLMFHKHKPIPSGQLEIVAVGRPDYVRQIISQSKDFSDTFLDMKGLSRSVADQVFAMPRWGLLFAVVATILGLLAISVPIGWTWLTGELADGAKIAVLETKVDELQEKAASRQPDAVNCRPTELEGKRVLLCLPK